MGSVLVVQWLISLDHAMWCFQTSMKYACDISARSARAVRCAYVCLAVADELSFLQLAFLTFNFFVRLFCALRA